MIQSIKREGYVICPTCLDESSLVQIKGVTQAKNELGFSDDVTVSMECEFGHGFLLTFAFVKGHIKLIETTCDCHD